MKITNFTAQQRNSNRVNVYVEGDYRFSVDIFQIAELGIRVGREYTEAELVALEEESIFGKLYGRALEYTMIRPHSVKEVRDYLWRKTRNTKVRNTKTGEWKVRQGVPQSVADRVLDRLMSKGYVNDEKFTKFWVENRNQRKGTSIRKLEAELRSKGVDTELIREALQDSTRDDMDEILKIIQKRAARYDDSQKLISYLARQGFSYDTIKDALSKTEEEVA